MIPNSTSFLSLVAACLFLVVGSKEDKEIVPVDIEVILRGESNVISICRGLSGFYLFVNKGIRGVPLNIPTYPSMNIEFDN
jgi:hypothetical protein